MGLNMRGDKNSLALLSSKRVKAYTRTKADEAFALPSFSDAMPVPPMEPPRTSNAAAKTEQHVEHDSENVKQTMLQHESVFKEQLHELHRLYQKQCVLMAESQKGHAGDPRPGPPSSNSSLLYNPDSFKQQEDRSLGDTSVSKPFNNDQTSSAFPTQMVGAKPFEVNAERAKQGYDRPILDLEHPADGCSMLDLERPADDVPFFDLEHPTEEYIHAGQVTGMTCTVADATISSNRQNFKEYRGFTIRENRDLISGKDKESWASKKLDFYTGYDCKDTFGSQKRMFNGYSQYEGLGHQQHQHLDFKEDHLSPMGPFTKTLDFSRPDSLSCPVEAASTSALFRGLPDLNGELSSAENQTPLMQRKPDKNVSDRWYIDLEAESRAPNGTSNLPHWLVQPPPKALRMSAPPNFPSQTSESPQKTTFFPPQVHAKSKSLAACTPSPGDRVKAPTLQDPYHLWSHINTTPQQRQISFQEPIGLPSLPFFSGGNSGAAQGPYEAAHVPGLANESLPPFLPNVRGNDKMNLSTASRVSSSVDRPGIVFDARAASVELHSRISSREPAAASSALPWYQQKESFSSLMHQASNPEPPFHRASYVSSVNPWEAIVSHQVLSVSGVNNVERDFNGMHPIVGNLKGPYLMTVPESHTKDPVFDFMSSSTEKGVIRDHGLKGNEATAWKQVEKPFYIGQISEKTTSTNNDHILIPSRNGFDLNVSCESLALEENCDAYRSIESRSHANQIQGFKQECETIRGTDWDILRGNTASQYFNEQQKGLDPQGTGFADRAPNKRMGFDISNKDAIQSPNESPFFTRAGMPCSQRHRPANDNCADCCSGEDETGGGFVEVKSSDASGLTSCESRDAAHLDLAKARDDSNTSSGEACQSRESGVPCHKEDVALSSNVQSKKCTVLPLTKASGLVESHKWESFLSSTMQCGPGFDAKGDCSTLLCAEFGDESEAAHGIARKHSMETAEAAELLLSLGLDLPPVADEGYATGGNDKSLDWLANIIPPEENCEAHVLDVDMTSMAMHGDASIQPPSMDIAEKIMDPFELAILALKPIDPDVESLAICTMDRASFIENCSSLPNLRRRSSRRGRAGKDFQREVLRSMTSLSRQEITEDLQIIEGLINSTTEAMNSCLLSLEDKPVSSPDSDSQKKARGTKACRGRRPSGASNVCSWGESTRRKRMGRQRSQWSCLPLGVPSSPFINNTGDGASLM